VETIQVVDGLLGIIGRLVHHIRGSFRLELAVCAYPHLPDRPVLAKQIVQVWPGDVPVTVGMLVLPDAVSGVELQLFWLMNACGTSAALSPDTLCSQVLHTELSASF
jgi:hypothetical protein